MRPSVGPDQTSAGCNLLNQNILENLQPATISSGRTGQSESVSAAEDEADVEGCSRGDVSAFERIVRRWQTPLINLAYRFCRDRSRAEDMAQEAFLRTFRSLAKWRKEAAFSTWLFALATNLYRSELKRFPAKTISFDSIAEPVDHRGWAEELESIERSQSVSNALLTLPLKYREALILFYFHDMDVSAAASSLGLPDGTVKARLFRGREILKAKLLNKTAQMQKEA